MRNFLNKILTLGIILLFFYQVPVIADDNDVNFIPEQYTCGQIVDNYLDAIIEFDSVLKAMIPLSDDKDVTTALKTAKEGIKQKNITYNALQAYDGAISAELKTHPNPALTEGENQLKSQLGSMHTRVDQWGSSNCREKHACDLGEAGYCANKHV